MTIRLITVLVIVVCIWAVTGCATTTFYENGKVIARFQGDMKNVEYQHGETVWKCSTYSPSELTLAQGKAAEGKINAIAAGAVAYLLK